MKIKETIENAVQFLNQLEKKLFGFFMFLVFAVTAIFLYEWNEGRMKEDSTQNDIFIITKVVYDKILSVGTISILETTPLKTEPARYSVEVKIDQDDFNKLKLKKNNKLKIKNTILYNNSGKFSRRFEKIIFKIKGKEISYDLTNE